MSFQSSSTAAAAAAVFGVNDEDEGYYPAATTTRKVIVGSSGGIYYDDADDDNLLHYFHSENSSVQCTESAWEKLCCLAYCSDENHDNDKPLWWLVLRWMKMMLFKMIRSYHAKPVILVLAPLVVGLLVGYWMGARQSQPQEKGSSHNSFISVASKCCKAIGNAVRWLQYFAMTLLYRILPPSHDSDPVGNSKSSTANKASASSSTGRFQNSTDFCAIEKSLQDDAPLTQREENVRTNLKSDQGTTQESGVPSSQVPKHVAVIMDGNRRYGKAKYGSGSRGHWDGSSKLVEFTKWCLAEHIQVLTVFAFSSENWNRDPAEVASLMQIFAKYCDELREEAIQRNIKIVVLSTDYEKIPAHVQKGVKRMVEETQHCDAMIMNICLSYGSRGEMVAATKSVVEDVLHHNLDPSTIDEDTLKRHMLTHTSGGDPDVLIRTSGEVRISNFLLWQLAYTELFFVDKPWPAMDKEDLLQVIRAYANGRDRRFGK